MRYSLEVLLLKLESPTAQKLLQIVTVASLAMSGLLFATGVAFAQGVDPAADTAATLGVALGMMVNTGGVFLLVFMVNKILPELRKKSPQFIPLIALVAGPLLNLAASAIGGFLGYEIDFSPVIGAFGGAGAVAAHQVHKQRRRVKAGL